MTFFNISNMFNRSLKGAFNRKRNLLLLFVLFFCSVFFISYRAFSLQVGMWWQKSLFLTPFFFSIAFLFSISLLMITLYDAEQKGKKLSLKQAFLQEGYRMLLLFFLGLSLLFLYFVAWFFLGFFLLLQQIPFLGVFISMLFSFVPLFLNLFSFTLLLFAFFVLFFACPIIAIQKHLQREIVFLRVLNHVKRDVFVVLILALVALAPSGILLKVFALLGKLTIQEHFAQMSPLGRVVQEFFMTLPMLIVLTPFVHFFFNFSTEAYYWAVAKQKTKFPSEESKHH